MIAQKYADAVEARIKELGWKEALRRLAGESKTMKDGYCENCLNPAECYMSGRCWPVVDCVPDAGKLCAEMDEEFANALASESHCAAAGTADEKPDGQAENA